MRKLNPCSRARIITRGTLHAIVLLLMVSGMGYSAETGRKLRVSFQDIEGKPIPATSIQRCHCRDLSDEPAIARIMEHNGSVTVVLPNQPVQVCALIKVPEFGEVTLYADNKGRGYSTPGSIDFVKEAAATRLRRVWEAIGQAKREGLQMPRGFIAKLNQARRLPAYKALAIGLSSGEELTLARARHRIGKLKGPRMGFLFGCNAMQHPSRGPIYDERYRALFNFGETNLYLSHYAPSENERNYARTDTEMAWLLAMGKQARTCPPFYIASGVTPQWLKNRPYSEVRRIAHDLVLEVTKRYAGKERFCEIVNEAHDFSNGLGLTPDELTDLAKVCSQAAREGDPNILRIINNTHLWADYASRLDKNKRPRRSPYAYLRDCIKSGVGFEITGLQMYYPEYDLFETDRMLDRYAKLGKPIHITEMGCSSAPGIDPHGMRKRASAGWHGPWTEEMQADWVEAIYTLCYSKPYIQAVCWWDLADGGEFWPYGGLLHEDLSPKPAYLRLQKLLREWGFIR